ncbi:BON domain-containing protein [Pseudobdellovibrio exovorus]|uniref:BON domain-containing protein n=1 Tax=Pseudobdellovibrio exovorus JSS TaxID=1184267 RepID=M4VAA5_9BACT|nr:BON domain-containing protein [Pseudobdellovibrio exovorus]AGH95400.1 hypothetical protein A11Q_1184 [Pseudobdellovibrio exovorus JSS]
MQNRNRHNRHQSHQPTRREEFSQGYRSRLNNDYANNEGYRSFQDMSDSGLRSDFNSDRSDDGGYFYGPERSPSQMDWQRGQRNLPSSHRGYNDYSNIEHDRSYGAGYPRAGEFEQGRNATSSQYHGTRHDMNHADQGRFSSEVYGRGSQWGQASEHGQTSQRGQFSGKGPKGFRRSDDRIKEEVCEALEYDSDVDASEIDVSVKEGICTLTGSISSRQMKRQAEACAENVRGVQDVRNDLRVDTTLASQGMTNEMSSTEAGSRSTLNGNRNNLGRNASSTTSSTSSSTKQ